MLRSLQELNQPHPIDLRKWLFLHKNTLYISNKNNHYIITKKYTNFYEIFYIVYNYIKCLSNSPK